MANLCMNVLSVVATSEAAKEDLNRFNDGAIKSYYGEEIFDLNRFVPVQPGGDPLNAHGTRRAYEATVDHLSDLETLYTFATNWSPADEWFKKVVRLFPALQFEYTYDEPGCGVLGVMRASDGAITEDLEPESFNEWDLIAFRLDVLNEDEDSVREQYDYYYAQQLAKEYGFKYEIRTSFSSPVKSVSLEIAAIESDYKFMKMLSPKEQDILDYDLISDFINSNPKIMEAIKMRAMKPYTI